MRDLKDLQTILACPKCKGEVEILESEGEVRCLTCRLAYPIREGLPVMLASEARELPAS